MNRDANQTATADQDQIADEEIRFYEEMAAGLDDGAARRDGFGE
jgi:hypothetical protein